MKRFFALYCIGYIIAVVVAVLVTELLIFGPDHFSGGRSYSSFSRTLEKAFNAIGAGLLFTFVTALPGFIITVTLANRFNMHSIVSYSLAGIITALLAHAILALLLGGFFAQSIWILACSLPGGAAGAYAYSRWQRKFQSA